jgi:hypothetical protein
MAAKKKWSHKIKTVSTYPPKGIFTKDAATIARSMASKCVSPRGIGSGIRMIQMFINRAGKNLPAARRRELEKAKHIIQSRLKRAGKANKMARSRKSARTRPRRRRRGRARGRS